MLVGIITLGCDKNTVDNEYLAGLLEDGGCEVEGIERVADSRCFDAVVLTTCGFILDAKQQSIEKLVELAEQKRALGNPSRIYVSGCLSQRHAEALAAEVDEVDGWAGVGQFESLAKMIIKDLSAKRPRKTPTSIVNKIPCVDVRRIIRRRRLADKPYSFLKIADGCNHHCAFCAIPKMKGAYRSVAPDILLSEARSLLRSGVRELNLVAQDITGYGADRWKDYRLPELLRELCALEGDFLIRCMYCYPGGVSNKLLEVLASESKIAPYLDIPLQHLDPDVLKRMRRPSHGLNAEQLISKLRSVIPDIALRTTMIVGFPGETFHAHKRLLEGIRRINFDWLGVFRFSAEDGAAAAKHPRQVGAATSEKRWHEVMQLQSEITAEHNDERIGRRERVLIEDFDESLKRWTGRGSHEAPEVDGRVFVDSKKALKIGEFTDVVITGADVYDVYATSTSSDKKKD
jgi:ribosomal protein S12 methylthiotransferase